MTDVVDIKKEGKLQNAIMCDLDGTLSINDHGRKFWGEETALCDKDSLSLPVSNVLKTYISCNSSIMQKFTDNVSSFDRYNGFLLTIKIIYMSGRENKYRPSTVKFLKKHNLNSKIWTELHMRKTGDYRPDTIIKKELYNAHVKDKYNVIFVLDDREGVVNMWRNELGLACFQVANGNF